MTALVTAQGTFWAHFTERGLARLQFPGEKPAPPRGAIQPARVWLRQVSAALRAALTGKSPGTLPPLDLSTGTSFQKKLWHELCRIPPGRVNTYGELARILGKPRAARAVGQACGANPIPVLIPCHRVVAANGALGGFSAPMKWKRHLLAIEGHTMVEHNLRGKRAHARVGVRGQ